MRGSVQVQSVLIAMSLLASSGAPDLARATSGIDRFQSGSRGAMSAMFGLGAVGKGYRQYQNGQGNIMTLLAGAGGLASIVGGAGSLIGAFGDGETPEWVRWTQTVGDMFSMTPYAFSAAQDGWSAFTGAPQSQFADYSGNVWQRNYNGSYSPMAQPYFPQQSRGAWRANGDGTWSPVGTRSPFVDPRYVSGAQQPRWMAAYPEYMGGSATTPTYYSNYGAPAPTRSGTATMSAAEIAALCSRMGGEIDGGMCLMPGAPAPAQESPGFFDAMGNGLISAPGAAIANGVDQMASAVGSGASALIPGSSRVITQPVRLVTGTLADSTAAVGGIISATPQGPIGMIQAGSDGANHLVSGVGRNVGGVADAGLDAVGGLTGGVVNAIGSGIGAFGSALGPLGTPVGWLGSGVSFLGNGISRGFDLLGNGAQGLMTGTGRVAGEVVGVLGEDSALRGQNR